VSRRLLGFAAFAITSYLLLEWVLGYQTTVAGLVTPRGAPDSAVIAVAVAYGAARVVVRVALPAMLAYAAAQWVIARARRPR
jgi:hypothetical protein